jgi:hypothetical protein
MRLFSAKVKEWQRVDANVTLLIFVVSHLCRLRAVVLGKVCRDVIGADQAQFPDLETFQFAGLDVAEQVRPAYAGSLG